MSRSHATSTGQTNGVERIRPFKAAAGTTNTKSTHGNHSPSCAKEKKKDPKWTLSGKDRKERKKCPPTQCKHSREREDAEASEESAKLKQQQLEK
ncbi:hypothetical protein AVEN_256687-1 [Araneus ventricosus]|uniref:Uncharacterized protein n=1 Tax=Araneus ventricosus TaxID=182803 RepID=A0A4Y2EI10_ARAVE|nr:hypothetical protein AVEN_256687-1 [Araneus ventricosus]